MDEPLLPPQQTSVNVIVRQVDGSLYVAGGDIVLSDSSSLSKMEQLLQRGA